MVPDSKERGKEYDCICGSPAGKEEFLNICDMSIYSDSHLNKLIPT